MSRRIVLRFASGIAVAVLVMASCGGGGDDDALPTIAILVPTASGSHATTDSALRVGGSISGAAFVHVVNQTTGARSEGYVNVVDDQGSWFADVYGLVPGVNVLVAVADEDGSGRRTADASLVVTRTPP